MTESVPAGSPAPGDGAARPLHGLRVVELSSYVATPLSGMTLAQLGAEVIRVEPLGGGADRGRWPLSRAGVSLYWTGLNRGKRAVEVDLLRPEGRRLVADLVVDGGGILVSNTERWSDLGFEALRERRPDVVHVQLTGLRDGGAAVDYTVQAGTGFPLITGPDGLASPVNHVLPAWDVAAGLYLATGLLAAERHRTATGTGVQVRVALEDVALSLAGILGYLGDAQLGGPRARDDNYVYGTFGRDFVSSDGVRFMLVALTARQWSDLLEMTGLRRVVAELGAALGADFDTEDDRYRHRTVLASLLAEWCGRRSWDEISTALARTRILWSPYRSFTDLAADDARLLRGNPLFQPVEEEGVGSYLAPGSPIVVDGAPSTPLPAPEVGEHTLEVFGQDLGLPAGELHRLAEHGVLRMPARKGMPV
ncbi:CoA transferase [Geodermatophilus sp. DF01_2]|uniref:CoA transferase n=1 Tax=Geodermatophilus sp. DF01-2 TaxID=2559610 RepID=UPI001FD7991A|nr:CoA transferase [Geodermatophilus sp. DF01_2]